MSKTYSLDLDFYEPKEMEICFAPIVHIYIKSCSFYKENSLQLITCECRTMGEINFEINRLQSELEDIRKKAEKKFKEFERKREIAIT